MTKYTITNTTSGADIGTYEGETALDAYRAMMADAGYRTQAEAESAGYSLDAIPADVDVELAEETYYRATVKATGEIIGPCGGHGKRGAYAALCLTESFTQLGLTFDDVEFTPYSELPDVHPLDDFCAAIESADRRRAR